MFNMVNTQDMTVEREAVISLFHDQTTNTWCALLGLQSGEAYAAYGQSAGEALRMVALAFDMSECIPQVPDELKS